MNSQNMNSTWARRAGVRGLRALALGAALVGGLSAAPPLVAAPIATTHPPVFGAPAAPTANYTGLSVLTGSGIATLVGAHRARSYFGLVTAAQASFVHTFLLHNDTASPVVISALTPSDATLSAAPAVALPVGLTASALQPGLATIPPGGVVPIRVQASLQGEAPGLVLKYVQVFVQGQDQPAATLYITGCIVPPGTTTLPTAAVGVTPTVGVTP